MLKLFGSHWRSVASAVKNRTKSCQESLDALLEKVDAKLVISKLENIEDRLNALPDLDNEEHSHEKEAISAITLDLKKRGYVIKGEAEPNHPIFVKGFGKFLCQPSAFVYLGNYAGAMINFKEFVEEEMIAEVQRDAKLILAESDFYALEVYVAGLSFATRVKSLARNQGFRIVENIDDKFRVSK